MNSSQYLTKMVRNSTSLSFSSFDYIIVFMIVFVLNILSGFYFTYCARKQSTTSEYLMGGRTMTVLPITISLIASYTSSTTLLAIPADVYRYGAAYLLGGISSGLLTILTIYFYLPVFFKLGVTSIYEYLEIRFDYRTRLFASFLSVLSFILYLPLVIYVPSLAFSAATGINMHLMATTVCGLCIFYTAIGGLKAVVWTDTLQFTIAVVALIGVLFFGLKSTGGFWTVWMKAVESKRLDIFDFDLDPTKRDSFWSLVIGLTTMQISVVSVAQGCVQKFLALPTFRKAALSVIYFGIGVTIVKSLTVFLGLLIYAKYSDCDPVSTHKIATDDQLIIYFVLDVAKNVPGLPGFFIAGVFSAALSVMSAELNCLAGIIYEDFVLKLSNRKFNEKDATSILKLIVIVTGIVCTLLVYVVEHLGGLFSLAMSLEGVTGGSILGMFTLGIFFPTANATGAFFGGLSGLIAISAIVFPAQYYQSLGFFKYAPKATSTRNCSFGNETIIVNKVTNTSYSPPTIFQISFYYYTFIGTCVTLFVGLLISFATNKTADSTDKEYFSSLCSSSEKSKTSDVVKQC